MNHSDDGKQLYSLRSQTIERIFADAKEKHFMRYTYLRGLAKLKNADHAYFRLNEPQKARQAQVLLFSYFLFFTISKPFSLFCIIFTNLTPIFENQI